MNIGILVFPQMTLLDFAGPWDVFNQLSSCKIKVIAKSPDPVTVTGNLAIVPDTTIAACPPLDVIVVPGGPGIGRLIEEDIILNFLRDIASKAQYITSVCTGSLVLGAAGLLKGYRATTHWLSLDLLSRFGAIPTPERVVIDRNRITGGGVTAGIDFALQMVAEIAGADEAKRIQLLLEYNPAPPFQSGHPSVADAAIVQLAREQQAGLQKQREVQVRKAAQLFCE